MNDLLAALEPAGEEWSLAQSIDPNRLPAHIAIIMDGNGRWARQRRLPRAAGHRAGIEPVRTCVQTCAQLGIQALTVYAFSTENWKRPRLEVDMLWRLLQVYLRRELQELIRNDVVFSCLGRLEALPAPARAAIHSAMRQTSCNRGLRLNVAVNYSGRTELVHAMNTIVAQARSEGRLDRLEVDENLIASHLFTAGLPDPDLLIRTSGEMRVSNFLLWQIAYSEIYVTDTLWPDFSRSDLLRAIIDFQRRDRRFGGLRPATEYSEQDVLAISCATR
ncbi:MAG: isoprenyl transferase [Acidobacteriaceae bacterium]|nr:isoprenyl transferase [Acidobacteriaceae bacterium]